MKYLRPLVAAMCLMTGMPASAAIVSVLGDNVRFTYDDSTLYGSATVVGDSIFFLPTSFRAESLSGAGLVTVSEMLNIRIEVLTPGYWLEELQLAEQGDYFLDGAGTSVSVTGDFMVSSNTSAYSASDSFSAGTLTVPNSLTNWSAGASVMLGDTPGWGGDTDVDVDIENYLSATTGAGDTQAFVQKKGSGVGLMVTVVPVPAAVWLFVSALGLLGFTRRS